MVNWVETDRTLVCLQANEEELGQILFDARANGFLAADFRDSDLNNMRTAVAIGPFTREQGKAMFAHFRLA